MDLVSLFLMAKSLLRSTWISVRELSVWLLSCVLITYFFVLTTPFLIYRHLVTALAKMHDKDITAIVSGLSAMFHRDFDCIHEKPLHTIIACLRIKGETLSASRLQEGFLEKVIRKKDPANGQLVYPELQQHYTRFMGYSFLKWDRKFNVENHVSVYRDQNDVVVTRSTLMELWQDLMIKPFQQDRSPWEAILVENYVPDEKEGKNAPDWIVFMRLHHGIADGFCFEKILSSLFDSDYVPDFTSISSVNKAVAEKSVIESRTSAQQIQRLAMNLRCLAMGPYDLLNRAIRFAEGFHSLHFPAEEKSNTYFVVESEIIPVKEVKQIKQRLKMGFTTVLVGVAAGAIRKFLIRNAMPFPELYTTTIPFPSPDKRGEKLGNDFFLAGLDLPIDLDSQQARLCHVQKSLENLRHSSFMKMLDVFVKQLTNVPSPILRAVTKKSVFSTSYSSIPGPDKIITGGLGGCDLIEANFTHGLSSDSLGLAISSITFAGNLRMTLFVEQNLMGGSRAKAEQFVECLMEEYAELKKFALR